MNSLEKLLLVLSVAAAAVAVINRTQKFGPKGTIIKFDAMDCYEGKVRFVADMSNLCWYWECLQDNKTGSYSLLPRRCALGSRMTFAYTQGQSNPCLHNFNTPTDFDCTRTQDNIATPQEPECFKGLNCNGKGNATYEGNICWCQCQPDWSGAPDCSLPTRAVTTSRNKAGNNTGCWKDKGLSSPCSVAGGCANGGECQDLCNDFWCNCPVPFTAGKRCESFSCSTNPCRNGGTCNRGENNRDEVNSCTCPVGYSGLLCEEVASAPAKPAVAAITQAPATTPTAITQAPATAPKAVVPAVVTQAPATTMKAAAAPAATPAPAVAPTTTLKSTAQRGVLTG